MNEAGYYMKSSSPRRLNLQNWGGRTRTSNFPVNSRAVCQLTYTPSHRNHPHTVNSH